MPFTTTCDPVIRPPVNYNQNYWNQSVIENNRLKQNPFFTDYDHESGVPVIPDEFEESEDNDSAIYATPRQNVGNSTPGSVRRSSRIEAQTPTENDNTPRPRRVSAPDTPKIALMPQRVLTPKNNRTTPPPQRVLTPKAATPQARRVPTPQKSAGRTKRYSEPVTPKPKDNTGNSCISES